MNQAPHVPSPGGYERAYAQSYELAFAQLAQSDLGEICRRSGAVSLSDSSLRVGFCEVQAIVDIEQRSVISPAGILPMTEQLVILHYLCTAGGQASSGKLISFKDLADGAGYFPTFYKRAVLPVVMKFGDSLAAFSAAAAYIGGKNVAMGDAGASFDIFPGVTLSWIIWQGESGLPPEGSVLFDSGITNYLPVEDIAALCQSIASKLCSYDGE